MQGLVFNIQRYSIHDGGGIRTIVFLKGCPLRCPWCANPESQQPQAEIMRLKSQCINCKACPMDPEECPSGALKQQGKLMTVDEVLREVLKDEVFFHTSGGGVTLSGGEVLMQSQFAAELLARLKEIGIHTAIETSGFGSWPALDKISAYTDVVLFDLKLMDPMESKEHLGADIGLIVGNLERLVAKGSHVIPRLPLVPGYTLAKRNIDAVLKLVIKLGLQEVHLLPFHQYGSSKYETLGREYALRDVRPPDKEEVEEVADRFLAAGINVLIGGK